ncbi:MAG: hypothetical protein K2J99_03950 [Lachnospiraceae bacterium]|nr:hypothetical protein [Lachnospiraceae bacterium]
MDEQFKLMGYYDVEPLGRKYESEDGRIIRGIPSKNNKIAMEMFKCGMIKELMDKSLIPHMEVIHGDETFSMYIEEEKIPYVVYPYEWSWEMIYAAAECVLKANEVALKYGYQLVDPHSYNIVFRGTVPYYVDLGSFHKVTKSNICWLGRHHFLRNYLYPLRIASQKRGYGAPVIAKCLIGLDSIDIDLLEFTHFFSWKCPKGMIDFGWKAYNIIRGYSFEVYRRITRERAVETCHRYQKETDKLKKELRKYKVNDIGRWSNYHDIVKKNGELEKGNRFDRLCGMLNNLDIDTSFEFGGNQGVFSNMLVERGIVQRALCSDYDSGAIDQAFIYHNGKRDMYFAVCNVMDTMERGFHKRSERFKSDIVIALALTHHLILTQKVRLSSLLEILTQYTNRYILIEFMPLGLWDGKKAEKVPDWYTLEWFLKEMAEYFDVIETLQTEQNRIAILGELKQKDEKK